MTDTQHYDDLRVDREDGVARITLDSTKRLNSLHPTMANDFFEVVTELVENSEIRCIAITGTGEVFGAGANLAGLDGNKSDGPALRRLASMLHDIVVQLHQAEKPVVVGVNGIAAGAGFSLALTGDVVLVSDDASFEYAYQRVGLTGDGGSTFFLPRLVGLRRAKEIALLGEPISPERAVKLGVATEVVSDDEFDDRLSEMAERLASGPTAAFGATKRLLTESFDRGLTDQMATETDAIARATHTEDYARGHAAFFGDDEPEFVGR